MAIIEVQAVEFVVAEKPHPKRGRRRIESAETCYDGFIRWRTETEQTGRTMINAWIVSSRDSVDITGDVLSGKVSYRGV